jgi:hypothetical protein
MHALRALISGKIGNEAKNQGGITVGIRDQRKGTRKPHLEKLTEAGIIVIIIKEDVRVWVIQARR